MNQGAMDHDYPNVSLPDHLADVFHFHCDLRCVHDLRDRLYQSTASCTFKVHDPIVEVRFLKNR
jgi:hypothetical protein